MRNGYGHSFSEQVLRKSAEALLHHQQSLTRRSGKDKDKGIPATRGGGGLYTFYLSTGVGCEAEKAAARLGQVRCCLISSANPQQESMYSWLTCQVQLFALKRALVGLRCCILPT